MSDRPSRPRRDRPPGAAGSAALDALREEAARFRASFDLAPVGMAHVALGGQFLAANRKLCALLGYTCDELTALRFQDLTHPGDLAADLDQALRLVAGEIPSYTLEKRYRRKDGRLFWARLSASLVRDERGAPFYFVAIVEDVTAQKDAERALAAREAEFRRLLDHAPDIVARFDREFRHTYVNPAVEAATGLAPAAFLGRTNRELGMPPALVAAWEQGLAGVFATGEPFETWFESPRPDGALRRYWGRIVPERDADGAVVSALGVVRDVSDSTTAGATGASDAAPLTDAEAAYVQAQSAYAEAAAARAHLAGVLDVLQEAFVSLGPDWHYTYVNAAAGRLLGRDPAALLGRHVWAEFPDSDPGARAAHERVMRTRVPEVIEVDFAPWGRWFENRIHPAPGGGVSTFFQDITARKHAEAERERLLAAERQARARVEALARVSAALNAEREPAAIARVMHDAARSLLGAHAGGVLLLAPDGREFEVLARTGVPEAVAAQWRTVPNTPGLPPADVVAADAPLLLETRAALLAGYGHLADALDAVGTRALAVLPLAVGDGPTRRVFGALALDFPAERTFASDDRALLEGIAAQTALALDRARLDEAERAARRLAERRAALAGALAQARTPREVADVFAREAREAFGADDAGVALLDAGGAAFTMLAAEVARDPAELDPWRHFPNASEIPYGAVVRDGQPLVFRSRPAYAARFPAVAPLLEAAGTAAALVVPLLGADGAAFGAAHLNFGAAAAAALTDADVEAALATLAQGAQALERACLSETAALERRRLEAVLAALPVGVIVADAPEGRLRYANDAVRAIWGQAPASRAITEYSVDWVGYHVDADGRAIARRYAPAEWPLARALLTGAAVHDEAIEAERPDGGRRRVAVSAAPIRDAVGAVVGGVVAIADVSEAARAREALEAARAAAERANRAKSDFLATMSHELRTPLNAISGHVQLLEMELHGPVTDRQRDALGRVGRAQRHLLRLINDVLNYAKLEAGRVEYDVRATLVADVLADVVPLVEPQLVARGLRLTVSLPEDAERGEGPIHVWADREKLGQVLLNLLANAAKFTPSLQPDGTPGRVSVRLATRPGAPDVVFLRVRDTGVGIPPEKQASIFEPFVQAHAGYTRAAEGTGLGLAISRDLARGMGGDLRVRSAEGAGSTFTVTLRRVVDVAGQATDRRAHDERRDGGERRSGDDRRDGSPAAGDPGTASR